MKSYGRMFTTGLLAATLSMAGWATAGSLDPATNIPSPTMHTLEDIYRVLAGTAAETKIGIDNPGAPSSTMHTLDDIKQVAIAATNAAAGGKVYKTGVTISYTTGDDGTYQKGVAWPDPVFTVGTGSASNCVTDNRTGLMWLKNPQTATQTWFQAITYCENLDGNDGRGGYTDWRMPNVREMMSLFDYGVQNPFGPPVVGLLPEGHPLLGPSTAPQNAWTSTSMPWAPNDYCWIVNIKEALCGFSGGKYQSGTAAWPVRGGN